MRKLFYLVMSLLALSVFTMTVGVADGTGYKELKYDVLEDNTICITEIGVTGNTLEIPSEIDGKTVTEIAPGAIDISASKKSSELYKNKFVTTVAFPDTITNVPGNPFGFYVRLSLENIRISNDHPYLAVINGCLFSKPDKRLIFHNEAADESGTYTVPEGIKIIGTEAFIYQNTKKVILPSTLVEISAQAFYNADYLEALDMKEGIVTIGNGAFSGCNKLHNYNLPDSLEHIGSSVFPPYETPFGMFYGVKTLTIPKNVNAIDGPIGALEIVLSSENTTFSVMGVCLVENETMTLIQTVSDTEVLEIPEGIKIIGKNALTFSRSTSEVHIPSTVVKICSGAFMKNKNYSKASLSKIYIPSTVTEIEDGILPGDSKVTLFVERGSVAEEYAQRNNLSFNYTDTDSTDWLNN